MPRAGEGARQATGHREPCSRATIRLRERRPITRPEPRSIYRADIMLRCASTSATGYEAFPARVGAEMLVNPHACGRTSFYRSKAEILHQRRTGPDETSTVREQHAYPNLLARKSCATRPRPWNLCGRQRRCLRDPGGAGRRSSPRR